MSSPAALDAAIATLREHAGELTRLSLQRRRALADQCAYGVAQAAREWVEAACEAKRIPAGSGARAEEITAGPVAVVRYLRLLCQTLADVERQGRPSLPGTPRLVQGQVRVPVFPTRHLFDRLLFRPMTAETWLQPGVTRDELFGDGPARLAGIAGGTQAGSAAGHVVSVLGAGNVSSIPATDALTKILQENKAVVLKMNPVNQYLGPIFERALAPLMEGGFLQVVYGGAEIGRALVGHDALDEVHITGSIETHDTIVWGTDRAERERRRAAGTPTLNKPITSELGNVSPWAVLPGRYSDSELRFQAESVAASIVNNASFNCIATKVIITWKRWPDRARFLDMVEGVLNRVPPRFAYYPGACDRFAEFAGSTPADRERLPWTLVRGADPAHAPHLFERESFVCVCAETALDADSPDEFLERAVEFMNDRLWGTLAAALTVPRELRRRQAAKLDAALRELRYGTIGINQWPGIAYAVMSCPWGGYPGGDVRNVQSGIGFVHNTCLLERPEKTVLYSPLKFWPKPIWFPSHRNAEAVAWKLLELYERPSVRRLPRLLMEALRG